MEVEIQASVCALNDSWGDGKHLSALFHSWDHTKLLKRMTNMEIKIILTIMNEWTTIQNKEADGMQLLHKIVAQCSDEIFNENFSSWIEKVVSVVTKKNSNKSACLALMVLRNLIEKSSKFQNTNKLVSSQVVSQVVQCLEVRQLRLQAFDCLVMCLKYYGGSCGTHKVAIERHIAEVVVNEEMTTEVLFAAKCLSWLPLAGGGGVNQVGHQAAWKLLQLRLIGALQKEMDVLFENVRELPISVSIDSTQNFQVSSISETRPVARLQQSQRRIHSLCCYLNTMVTEPVPLTKSILVQEILQLVCRGLAVTGLSLGTSLQSLEVQALKDLLPAVHISMLSLVTGLITGLGKNMLPYHPIIFQLIINTLKWTKKETSGGAYSGLRCAGYNTLTLWTCEAQALSGIQHFLDSILPHVVPDITPEKDCSVSLKAGKQNARSKKRKSKGPGVDDIYKLQFDVALTGNSTLCEAALEALTSIFQAAGCLLKPEHHKLLQQLTMPAAVNLLRGGEPHPLYQRPTCQLKLLELLLALVLQPHAQVPPPTSWAITVFNAGQTSQNHEVCQFSKQAIRMCERLVHPMSPSLMLGCPSVCDDGPTLRQQSPLAYNDTEFVTTPHTPPLLKPPQEPPQHDEHPSCPENIAEKEQDPEVISLDSEPSDVEEEPIIVKETLPSDPVVTQNDSSELIDEIVVAMEVEQQVTTDDNLTQQNNISKKCDVDEEFMEMIKDFADETC